MDVQGLTRRFQPVPRRGGGRPAAAALMLAWLTFATVSGFAIAARPQLGLILVALGLGVGAAARFPAATATAIVLVGAFAGSLRALTDDELPVRTGVQLLIVSIVVAVTLSHALGSRTRALPLVPAVVLVAAFLAINVVQIPFAETTLVGAQAFRATALPIFLLLAVAYATWPPEVHSRIAHGIVLVAAAVGTYALLRLVTGPTDAERELAESSIYNIIGDDVALVGSFASRQELSSWAAVAVPFCFAFAVMPPGRGRWLPAAAAALCLVALIGSETRTALVAVGCGLALVAVMSFASRGVGGVRVGRISAVLTGLVVIGGVGFALILGGSESSVERYSSIVDPDEDRTFEVRTEKWEATARAIEERPFGHGLGSAGTTRENYGRFVQLSAFEIDNTYLEVAYQQGIAPLLLFVGALLALLYTVCRTALGQVSRLSATIAVGTAGALAAWLVLLTTLSQLENSGTALMWILLGLAVAASVRREPDHAPNARQGIVQTAQ